MKDWQTFCHGSSGCFAAAYSQNDDGKNGMDRCMLPMSQTELLYFIGCVLNCRKSGNWMTHEMQQSSDILENHKKQKWKFSLF